MGSQGVEEPGFAAAWLASSEEIAIDDLRVDGLAELIEADIDRLEQTAPPTASYPAPGRVARVAIAPDGTWLATATDDRRARIWASTGTPHHLRRSGSTAKCQTAHGSLVQLAPRTWTPILQRGHHVV